ncbi:MULTISPECIES: beta strand repeat-containing protein [unclassified Mesorhizobium]|uniref:beta strand repeat-containing protein n=1 Tax=unclassified Mesorhizobium TaxID=325217 RepID=UPI003015344E
MTFKLTLATTTAVGLLMGAAFAGSENEAYIDQIGGGNSASIVQGQSNGSAVGNRAGHTTQRIRQDGADNELIINQTHDSNVTSPPRNQINRAGSPGDQAGLGIDQIGNSNYLRIDQTGPNQAVFEVQQNGGTSATTSSNNATITQSGGWSARVSNLRQTFTGSATDDANDVTITQTGQSSRVGNTSSGPRNDGSGAHQTGFGNDLTITQTGNSQLVYTATQTNNLSAGGANIASISQGGGNGNQLRELSQVNTGAADNIATLTFSGAGNGVTSGVFTGPALGVGVLQSRVRQTGEGNDISYVVTGSDNLFGLVQDGLGNWIVSTVDGSANQVAISQEGDGNSAKLEILGDSNLFGVAQTGVWNEALARASGNANELALSQIGNANLGEVLIGNRSSGNSDGNAVVLNQDSLASFGNVGEIYVDGNANTISLDQLSANGSNYGTVDVFGDENDVAVDQDGSNTGEVFVTGNLNVASLEQDGDINSALVDILGDSNEVDIDQSGDWNDAVARANGNANEVMLSQIGAVNTGLVDIVGDQNGIAIEQDGEINSALVDILGDGNQFVIDQSGDWNDAVAQATGNDNKALIDQIGSLNTVSMTFQGDSNGSGILTGAAGLLVSTSGGQLVAGRALQDSSSALSGNSLTYDVVGNLNQFAFAQIGGGNSITGLVGNAGASNGNQAAVLQNGSNNVTSFTQNGSSNNLSVSQ